MNISTKNKFQKNIGGMSSAKVHGNVAGSLKKIEAKSVVNSLKSSRTGYKIGNDCISCGTCVDACPVEAISDGAEHYEIDATQCLECGACAASCPASAITAP